MLFPFSSLSSSSLLINRKYTASTPTPMRISFLLFIYDERIILIYVDTNKFAKSLVLFVLILGVHLGHVALRFEMLFQLLLGPLGFLEVLFAEGAVELGLGTILLGEQWVAGAYLSLNFIDLFGL